MIKPLIFSSSLWGDTKRCGPYEIIHKIWPRFWPPPLISVRTLRNNTMHEHMSIISVLHCFTLIYVLYLWIFVCVFWHNYASVLAALACMCWSGEVCSCTCDGEISCQRGFIHIFWINVDCVIPLFYMSLCECVCLSAWVALSVGIAQIRLCRPCRSLTETGGERLAVFRMER